MKVKSSGGFTVIELMVVCGVIGVIAATFAPMVKPFVLRAKGAQLEAYVHHLQIALEEGIQGFEEEGDWANYHDAQFANSVIAAATSDGPVDADTFNRLLPGMAGIKMPEGVQIAAMWGTGTFPDTNPGGSGVYQFTFAANCNLGISVWEVWRQDGTGIGAPKLRIRYRASFDVDNPIYCCNACNWDPLSAGNIGDTVSSSIANSGGDGVQIIVSNPLPSGGGGGGAGGKVVNMN